MNTFSAGKLLLATDFSHYVMSREIWEKKATSWMSSSTWRILFSFSIKSFISRVFCHFCHLCRIVFVTNLKERFAFIRLITMKNELPSINVSGEDKSQINRRVIGSRTSRRSRCYTIWLTLEFFYDFSRNFPHILLKKLRQRMQINWFGANGKSRGSFHGQTKVKRLGISFN